MWAERAGCDFCRGATIDYLRRLAADGFRRRSATRGNRLATVIRGLKPAATFTVSLRDPENPIRRNISTPRMESGHTFPRTCPPQAYQAVSGNRRYSRRRNQPLPRRCHHSTKQESKSKSGSLSESKTHGLGTRKTGRLPHGHRLCGAGVRAFRKTHRRPPPCPGSLAGASQSTALNNAKGNGENAEADRRRSFEIARGSVLECAAIQDVLVVGRGWEENESRERKIALDRMPEMLNRLGKRGYSMREERPVYRIDFDSDPDFDTEGQNKFPTCRRWAGTEARAWQSFIAVSRC